MTSCPTIFDWLCSDEQGVWASEELDSSSALLAEQNDIACKSSLSKLESSAADPSRRSFDRRACELELESAMFELSSGFCTRADRSLWDTVVDWLGCTARMSECETSLLEQGECRPLRHRLFVVSDANDPTEADRAAATPEEEGEERSSQCFSCGFDPVVVSLSLHLLLVTNGACSKRVTGSTRLFVRGKLIGRLLSSFSGVIGRWHMAGEYLAEWLASENWSGNAGAVLDVSCRLFGGELKTG